MSEEGPADKSACRYCRNDIRYSRMCLDCASLVFAIKTRALHEPETVLALLTDQARQLGFVQDLKDGARVMHKLSEVAIEEEDEPVQQDKHNDQEE